MYEHEELDREATPSEAVRARGSVRILLRRYRRLQEGATADDLDDSPPECDSKSSEAADSGLGDSPACPYMGERPQTQRRGRATSLDSHGGAASARHEPSPVSPEGAFVAYPSSAVIGPCTLPSMSWRTMGLLEFIIFSGGPVSMIRPL